MEVIGLGDFTENVKSNCIYAEIQKLIFLHLSSDLFLEDFFLLISVNCSYFIPKTCKL